MIPPITLIVADNMKQGNAVINQAGLDLDSCAVITNPSYFEHIVLNNNETVYAHACTSTQLFNSLNRQINISGHNINLKIINP